MSNKVSTWKNLNASPYKGEDLWKRFKNETRDKYPKGLKGGFANEGKGKNKRQRGKQRKP